MKKNNEKKEKLLLIDGNALIHRSFHAIPLTLTNKSGQVVNAVYGFTNFLLKAIKEIKPAYVVLTLDKKGPTFRHEAYEAYKANRTKAPDELYEQIPLVRQTAEVLGLPVFELSGYEADDLIGTICKKTSGVVDTVIVTGDQDTMQLVDEDTFVFTMSKGVSDSALYGPAEVKAKYGFEPILMIDYKGLRGDPSDNIPGVKGIGEKTANELIAKFGTVENIYKSIDSEEIKPRTRQLLIDGQESAKMSKALATINCEAPIDFELSKSRFGGFDEAAVLDWFAELEFKSLMPKLRDLVTEYNGNTVQSLTAKLERNKEKFAYKLVQSDKEFKDFLNKLHKQKKFTFDTETTGLDQFTAELLGISFSWTAGEAYFVWLGENRSAELNLFNFADKPAKNMHAWLQSLAPIFEDQAIKKFGHNLKFDIKVLGGLGIEVRGAEFDTMIASYLLRPDNRQHSLDALAFSELGFTKISKEELTGEKSKNKDFAAVAPERLASYSCEDADVSNRLVAKLSTELNKENLDKVFIELEMPLVTVLAKMENAGILLDKKYFAQLDKDLDLQIEALEKKIYKAADQEFNIGSVKQLREILFEKLQISVAGIAKKKTGLSTGAAELEKLKDAHEIVPLILDWRELSKLSNTYVKALPELINSATGRLHTNFNQTVAATGRLSSTNPNLQNIPMRTELGRAIRRGFVAAQGQVLLSLDYSQIELRLAAHMSGDPGMIHAFENDLDIHTATAAAINKVSLQEVTKEMRRAAKATNFGLLYGQGAHGLSESAGISYAEAKAFINKYFAEFSHIKNYIDSSVESAKENGYSETLFGRRRYLPDINSSVPMIRKSAERMAVNTPLQGTAADMIKLAMIRVDKMLDDKYRDKAKMILQVHDELVFEVNEKLVNQLTNDVKQIMESVIELNVPILVEAKSGANWEEMEDL